VGADDRCPMPHTAEGRPADDVATIVVGFSPIIRSPARPSPSFAPLYSSSSSYSSSLRSSLNRHSQLYSPPPPPLPPIPSSSTIERQRESQRKPRHVRPLVRAQDANREVGHIVARRRSRSNDRLPQRRRRHHFHHRRCGYGWRGGVGCGRGESVLCVVLCGTS
jgi:hypothetical protein